MLKSKVKTSKQKPALKITDLHVVLKTGKEIIKGISLTIHQGEIHVLMGPNGGGKSTLALALMGHPDYQITSGKIDLAGTEITALSPDSRAKLGLFLGFQYPVEIPGVNFPGFLRLALNEKNNRTTVISPIMFRKTLTTQAAKLDLANDLTHRTLNEGFSGGEKKKSEILQMIILKPSYAILDEPDSGLDVDALKYISKAINELDPKPGIILVTHYQRILRYIKPDYVHIIVAGKLVESGNANLAKKIETEGYEKYQD